ncbi:hypothetical protein DY251_12925 [Mesorhizobium denitrificans]|uniref:Uncharacterized protein n=1 Tax=Mesorhizobium denitrificans TaxID=2294114 RepID=A0A371XCW9_9HYPH|nr:hypothetical protein DY251_12925 [Mesorhizobium denitrificans]
MAHRTPTFAVALVRVALKSPCRKIRQETVLDITTVERPAEYRNEEVLIFLGGRLFDRFEVPSKSDRES